MERDTATTEQQQEASTGSVLSLKNGDAATRMLVLGLVLAAVAYGAGKLAGYIAGNVGGDTNMVGILTRSVVAVVGFIALGGAAWLRPSLKSIRETWSFAKPLIIINLVIGFFVAMSVLSSLMEETISIEDALSIGGYVTVLCFFVGINEEAMFRGLVLGGLLAKLGTTSNGVLKAAIISSLLFGFIHVAFDMNYANLYSIGAGLFKTLSSGMFALILCVPVIKGRNLWGAITAHAFFDWVLLCGNSIQQGGMLKPAYTSDNPQIAVAAMAVFGIMCLLYLPRTIRAFKELRDIEVPQLGPFMH